MRTFIFALLAASEAAAGPAVYLAPAIGTPTSVTLSGRVLKNTPGHSSTTFSKNLRALVSSSWEGAAVEVRFAGRTATVTSGPDGNFETTFSAKEGAVFEVGLQSAEARVKGADADVASVDVMSPEAPFFVISDFDDTIAVTNVLNTGALVQSALLKDELTQPVVEGMAPFYRCLRDEKPARPAFALVSGSPIQYLGRVSRFLSKHSFPMFGLYLRELGLGTLSNYKQPIIRALLKSVPNKVVLIGDSGEHDPEIYAQMRAEFPDRVAAVYLRNAGNAQDTKRFKDALLFTDPAEAAQDAVTRGLASRACVDAAFPPLAAKRDAGAAIEGAAGSTASTKEEGTK